MRDFVGLFLFLILGPLIGLIALGALSLFAYSRLTSKHVTYKNLLTALWPAFMVAVGFPIACSLTVGIFLGPFLGGGFVLVLISLTAIVTLGSYVFFAIKGITGVRPR